MSKMLKLKRGLLAMVSLVLVVALVTSIGAVAKRERKEFVKPDTSFAETGTNRYAQYVEAVAIAGNRLTTEGFEKKLENDAMELWLREESASIRVVDKKSGYVWGELKGDSVEDLNDYWAAMANSMFTIEYYDNENTSYQRSMSDPSFVCQYTADDETDVLTVDADCEEIGIAVIFTITLTDDHFEIEVAKDGIIEYDPNFVISRMYLLPFFGTTQHGEMDGYIFVPDGSGALIRFDKHTLYGSSYSAKLFGKDGGIDTLTDVTDLQAKRTDDYLVDTFRATLPVYGIVHGDEQYAAMTVIDGGQQHATMQASLASSITPYNWATTIFDYRQLYNQPVSKTNKILRPQADKNDIAPKLSIYLLSGDDASYNGMALKYRSLLEEEGLLDETAKTYEEQIPLRLEVVAADVKAGFIFNSVQTFTTAEEAATMQKDLADMDIKNLTMVINGWQKGGSNGHKYGKFTAQSTTGSLNDWAGLRDSVKNAGGKFYLQNKVVAFNEDQGRTSYLAAKTISKELAKYERDNPTIMYPDTYIASPKSVETNLQGAVSALKGFDVNLPRFGSELYSHYEQEQAACFTRTKTRNHFLKIADKVEDTGMNLALNTPNYYMFGNCTDYFDAPMSNSQYLFETDSVPFLQMLLKGHINYYAPYANQGFYTTACTLKSIEYGAYPSFLVMAADNGDLNKTPMVDYFSLNFEDWKGTIDEVYKKVNGALIHVEGAKINEHKALANGVVRVTYDNGAVIYVNYNSAAVEVDGVKIPEMNYVVKEG